MDRDFASRVCLGSSRVRRTLGRHRFEPCQSQVADLALEPPLPVHELLAFAVPQGGTLEPRRDPFQGAPGRR